MCRRFLEIEPRVSREKPDMRVHMGKLMPIQGGSEGVRQLFASIGQVKLALVTRQEGEVESGHTPGEVVMPEMQSQEMNMVADVTPLVPVAAVPGDGEAVLRALIESMQAGEGGFFDLWSRHGVSGTILGNTGMIGAAGEIRDLLGFALWLCRQAKVNDLDDLSSITIAVKRADDWLIDAARAMPVPIHWVRWRAYQLNGQLGLSFEAMAPA